MPAISVLSHGTADWGDLLKDPKKPSLGPDGAYELRPNAHWLSDKGQLTVARIPKGMASGKSAVAIRIDLPDGTTVVAETSLDLFVQTAQALKAADETSFDYTNNGKTH